MRLYNEHELIVTKEFVIRESLLIGMITEEISEVTGVTLESIIHSAQMAVERRFNLLSHAQKQQMIAEIILHAPKKS